VAYFKVMTQNLSTVTEENNRYSHPGQSMPQPRFEMTTSRIKIEAFSVMLWDWVELVPGPL
jgi:hypothetical protein